MSSKFVKFTLWDYSNANRDKREVQVASKVFSEVVVFEGGRGGSGDDGVTVVGDAPSTIKNSFLRHIVLAVRKAKKLRSLHADCVSCHDMLALAIGWVSTWFVRDKPVLVYDAHEFELGRKRGSFGRRAVFFLERFLMKRCAFTIVVNDSIADRMQEVYKLEERPVVVRNTPHRWELDPEETARKRAEFCSALGAREDSFLVMYHGGIMRGRGIENLIRAVAADESLRAIVLGDGEEGYLASLRDLARDEGVSGRVLFTPAVPIDELRHSVSAVDCGVSILEPTCENHRLALPNKFFECIQSETPVVVSDFPEMGRLVKKHNVGVLCDPSDIASLVEAFKAIRTDRSLYLTCKRGVAEAKEELCWERESKTLLQAYRNVADSIEQKKEKKKSGQDRIVRQEQAIALLIALFFCYSPIAQGVRTLLFQVGVPTGFSKVACYICLAAIALYALPLIIRRLPWKELLIFVALGIAVGFSWLGDSGVYDSFYIELLTTLLVKGLAAYVLCRSLEDYTVLMRVLQLSAYAAVVALAINTVFDFKTYFNTDTTYPYSPALAYQALPAAIILVDRLFHSLKIGTVVGLLGAMFFLLIAQVRTPLLVVCAFAFIELLLCKKLGRKRFAVIGSCCVFFVLLLVLVNVFMEPLDTLLRSLGVNSRMLYYFRADAFFASTGRDLINGFVFDLIKENPWFGVGVGSDRTLVFSSMQSVPPDILTAASFEDMTYDDAGGFYAHNLFVELVLQFGIPIGLLVGGGLVILLVASIAKSQGECRSAVLIFLGFSTFPLMLSGSYLTTPLFFGMLAVCVSQLWGNRKSSCMRRAKHARMNAGK